MNDDEHLAFLVECAGEAFESAMEEQVTQNEVGKYGLERRELQFLFTMGFIAGHGIGAQHAIEAN